MEHITQQSLALDRKDQIESSEVYKTLEAEETELLKEIETFKDTLASAQSDLVLVRKKLRFFRKSIGTHKTSNQIIYEYVKQNPNKRVIDIINYLKELGHTSPNTEVVHAKDLGVIIEIETGTYVVGAIPSVKSRGAVIQLILDYAKSKQWFTVRDCYKFSNGKLTRQQIANRLSSPYYRDKFEEDRSGKFIKYRLKDPYRSL